MEQLKCLIVFFANYIKSTLLKSGGVIYRCTYSMFSVHYDGNVFTERVLHRCYESINSDFCGPLVHI